MPSSPLLPLLEKLPFLSCLTIFLIRSLSFLLYPRLSLPLPSILSLSVSPNVHLVLILCVHSSVIINFRYSLSAFFPFLHALLSAFLIVASPRAYTAPACSQTQCTYFCCTLFICFFCLSPPTLHLSCLAGEETGGAADFRPQERPIILLKHWGQRDGGKEAKGEVRRGKGGGMLKVITA